MRLVAPKSMLWLFINLFVWFGALWATFFSNAAFSITFALFAGVTFVLMLQIHDMMAAHRWFVYVGYGVPVLVASFVAITRLPANLGFGYVLGVVFIAALILLTPWAYFLSLPVQLKSLFIRLFGKYVRVGEFVDEEVFFLITRHSRYVQKSATGDFPTFSTVANEATCFAEAADAEAYALSLNWNVVPLPE
jgi:hypothetical protein